MKCRRIEAGGDLNARHLDACYPGIARNYDHNMEDLEISLNFQPLIR